MLRSRRWLPIVALVAALLSARAEAAGPGGVYVARLGGVVDPIAARYLVRAIDAAEAAEATALVVVLDTPGGLSDATREMTQRMLAARVPRWSWLPSPKQSRWRSPVSSPNLGSINWAKAGPRNSGTRHWRDGT